PSIGLARCADPLTHEVRPRPQFTVFFLLLGRPLRSTLFPYTTLFRSQREQNEVRRRSRRRERDGVALGGILEAATESNTIAFSRSEEHTSELQSLTNLVCRLLLEKKKTPQNCRRSSCVTCMQRAATVA